MKKIIILSLLTIVLISTQAFSQAYQLPKFTVHITGGYGVPTGDFKVDVPTSTTTRLDADDFPYYTKQLLNFGADGKLSLGARGNARVTFGLTYNMFSNNTTGTFRLQSSTGPLGQVEFKPHVNVVSVALGGEYAFSPTQKVNPFVGAQLAANFFGGSFDFGQQVFTKGALRSSLNMKSETRIGIILDAGLDFRLSPQIGAVVGLKYHMINPIGKGADDETEIAANEVDLGDKEHVRDDGTTSPNKSLSSINGYAGITFFFGLLHK